MILEAVSLSKRFPDGTLGLNGASLRLETPSFVVLSGRNGSGKSLLARAFMGLEKPDAGSVLLDGRPLSACLSEARRRIALVFQEPEHQILGITTREDAEFGLRARSVLASDCRRRAEAALSVAGLSGLEDRLASALSGGEKRRLAVAGALVTGPELVILDEPFNDLDWQGASELLGLLLRLRRDGVGILIISHDLEKCLAHADRLIVMEAGAVIRDGSPAALWNSLPDLGLRRLPGGPEFLANMSWLKDPV